MDELTLKERTMLVLLSHGDFAPPRYVIRRRPAIGDGWEVRLNDTGYIDLRWGGEGWYGRLLPKGRAVVARMSAREKYQAEQRLQRLGYHL